MENEIVLQIFFYFSNDCSKDLRIFINCSVNLWFSFFIRWISSSWAIFISRWFLSSSSKVFWICWRLSRCRAAASRFRLRLRFRCCSWKVILRDKIDSGWKCRVFKLKEVWFQKCFFLSCLTYFSQDHSHGPSWFSWTIINDFVLNDSQNNLLELVSIRNQVFLALSPARKNLILYLV